MFFTKRAGEIKEIISHLEKFRDDPEYREAAEINIRFVKAVRSIFSYLHWLIFVGPKLRLRRDTLIELGDFPIKRWQRRGYQGLIAVQRHRLGVIMMTRGFVKELSRVIVNMGEIKDKNEALVILDLGFGGGELGRRVFDKLPGTPLVYIGVDIIPANIALARKLFQPLAEEKKISFRRVSEVNDKLIEALREEASAAKKVVAICLGDIFDLGKYISPGKVDIIWHSRVLHHLVTKDKLRLEEMCRKLSPITVEMDDRYCLWFKFWATIACWAMYSNVVFMNDAILSGFRDPSAKELTGYFKLVPPFSYVRLIFGENEHHQDEKWQAVIKTLVRGYSYRDPQ